MELLGPALGGILLTEENHKEEAELLLLLGAYGQTSACLVEDDGGVRIVAGQGGAAIEAVIGKPASCLMEGIVALLQGL